MRIYKDGVGGKPIKTVQMRRTAETDLWQAEVKGNLLGKYYTFDMGKGECPGVFAKAVGVNGQRGAIVNLVKTDPEDWCCDAHLPQNAPWGFAWEK